MSNFDKYILVLNRLRKRYGDKNGNVIVMSKGQPTKYTILETKAAVKYLGCNPLKMVDYSMGLTPEKINLIF